AKWRKHHLFPRIVVSGVYRRTGQLSNINGRQSTVLLGYGRTEIWTLALAHVLIGKFSGRRASPFVFSMTQSFRTFWGGNRMDRRSFITKAGLATVGAGAAALATPAIAQGNITWRMVTAWPKNFPGLGVGAQRLADRITVATGGRLTIQVYSAGEMVPALQALDAVIDGSAELSHGTPYYWQNKSAALSF